MFASCLVVRAGYKCRFACPRRRVQGAAAMLFARAACCGRPGSERRSMCRGGSADNTAPHPGALAIVPGDSLLTSEGLRSYRDGYLRPLLLQKRHALQQLTGIKTHCELVSLQYADYYAAGVFVLLTAQAVTLFYWVYFLFDWNLVEPITYLLGYGGVWLAIACHAATQRDFTYEACTGMIAAHYLSLLHRRHNFDVQLWQRLTAEVELLEERLRGLEGV
ncbi:uncharacterized protein Tco025E_05535 [Trypanosoma conorhini]|uniref:Calcium uniporter protein C-terminal domain-containing protein n=1 Tax=Trypanosoma conorhini TaxID=83891 RepID=A0A3R7L378_9TRYP|nr:uncharacterized protein Tco025E_05535 [Trypanosoma conorhini]RNF15432.1 hypothetical protein Tco025E_05535 [Trypanosoma conorhini]